MSGIIKLSFLIFSVKLLILHIISGAISGSYKNEFKRLNFQFRNPYIGLKKHFVDCLILGSIPTLLLYFSYSRNEFFQYLDKFTPIGIVFIYFFALSIVGFIYLWWASNEKRTFYWLNHLSTLSISTTLGLCQSLAGLFFGLALLLFIDVLFNQLWKNLIFVLFILMLSYSVVITINIWERLKEELAKKAQQATSLDAGRAGARP